MSPPHAGHRSGNSFPTRAISLASASREVSWERSFACGPQQSPAACPASACAPVAESRLFPMVSFGEHRDGRVPQDDEWFLLEAVVKGKSVRVSVDGRVLFEFVEPEGTTGTRRLSEGLFALQGHDPESEVRYRRIEVKRLD